MTSEDIKHQLIIIIGTSAVALEGGRVGGEAPGGGAVAVDAPADVAVALAGGVDTRWLALGHVNTAHLTDGLGDWHKMVVRQDEY